jgi:hypothetical protein
MARLNHPIVLIVWADAYSLPTQDWTPLGEVIAQDDGEYLNKTAGFLIPKEQSKPGHHVVYQSITPDDDVDDLIAIPDALVRSVTVLEAAPCAQKKTRNHERKKKKPPRPDATTRTPTT